MQEIAGKIDTAFAALESGETFEQVLSSDSMSVIAGKAQRNFAKVTSDIGIKQISQTDSMSVIAQKLKDNFDLVEQGEPIPPEPIGNTFSFLHISDPHGGSTSVEQMVNMLKGTVSGGDDCQFGLISGDLKAYGRTPVSDNYTSANLSTGSGKPPVLVINGNHDSYDSWQNTNRLYRTSYKMTQWMYGIMGNNVVWGDTNLMDNAPISGYWYKDFTLSGGNKLRLIAIDQYELVEAIMEASGGTFSPDDNTALSYNQIYTTAQFTWFVERLKELSGNDHVLITLHQSPFNDNSYIPSIKPSEPYYTGNALKEPERLWCSETMKDDSFCEGSNTNYNSVICEVMKAYMNSGIYSVTKANGTVGSNYQTGSFTVNADFTGGTPAKFWGYVFGHLHCDVTAFASSTYPKQPLLGITSANEVSIKGGDDLIYGSGHDYAYRINKVSLMLDEDKIKVERIGQQKTNGGRIRKEIVFDVANGIIESVKETTITQ